VAGDASAIIVRLSTPPSVALELLALGVGGSFKAKPPHIAALEVGRKGVAFMCARQNARLAAKCYGGSSELAVPHHRLPSKVVLRRRLVCPRSCSLSPLRGGASSSCWCLASTAPTDHVGWHE
jgi:hypothetical protein